MKSYIKGSVYLAIVLILAAGFTLAYVFSQSPDLLSSITGSSQTAQVAGVIGKVYEVNDMSGLNAAKTAIRNLPRDSTWRGATVVLHGGYYNLTGTLALDSADSGTTAYPVIYMGAPGEQAIISGGKQLQSSWFSSVTSATPNYSRIPSSVRANVYVANLKANGITDYGTLKTRGWNNAGMSFGVAQNTSPMELAFNGQMMTLARWPNFMQKTDGALNGFVRTPKMINQTQFQFPGTRYANWSGADVWIEGLYNEYVDTTLKATISGSGLVTLSGAPAYVEEAIARGAAIYAFNLIEELDTPGEYYIDRVNGLLYFYPPASLSGAKLDVSMLETPLISLNGTASNIVIRNLIIESGRHMGIQKYGYGTHDRIIVENSVLRNVGHAGVNFSRSTNSGLKSSIVSGVGSSGVNLQGGDRASLSPSRSFVEDTEIYNIGRLDRTSTEGVYVIGVGALVRNNYIHDVPHTGVNFDGNNHLVEYNIFRRVNYENSDAGVIYGGRDWGYQGNVIRYNIFDNSSTPTPQQVPNIGDNIGGGSLGGFTVYLDDALSGFTIYGNIFYNSGSTAVLYRGGFDVNVKNNIFVGSYNNCIVINRPGLYYPLSPSSDLLARLHTDSTSGVSIDYQSAAWKAAYPRLASMPNDWSIIKRDGWGEPRNSFIEKNICFGTTGNIVETGYANGPGTIDAIRKYGGRVETSLVVDPKFVNPSAGNFNFQSNSPVYTTPGFEVIPVANIGIKTPYQGSGAAAPATLPPATLPPATTDTTAPTISSVSSSNLTTNGATISWTTNEIADTQVEYGLTTTYGSNSALNTAKVTSHSVTLSSLQANTAYNYRVKSRDTAGNLATSPGFSFVTKAPLVPAPIPTVTSPTNNTSVTSGSSVSISVSLSGDASDLSMVEFYDGTTRIGQDSTSPYVMSYAPSAGSHTLSARALNTNGLSASSQGISVTVTNPAIPTPPSSPPPTTTGSSGIAQGLVAYYAFDEGQGSTATDSSGNGNTANLVSSPTRTAGKIGGAISLNGSDQYISAPALASKVTANAMTISAWVKSDTSTWNASDWVVSAGSGSQGFVIRTTQNSKFVGCAIGDGTSKYYSSVLDLNDVTVWHHLVCTFDGSLLDFYADGVSAGPRTWNITISPGSGDMNVGRSQSGTYGQGSVDDVRIYNRALSAAEVAELYAYSGSAPNTPPVTVTPTPTQPASSDSDNDGILNSLDKCLNTPPSLVPQVNSRGCPKPVANNFNIKPSFTDLDLTAVSAFEIGQSGVGKISFAVPVDLVKGTDEVLNLDSSVSFQSGQVSVDSSSAPKLNRPATVTMYGITAVDPRVMRDGVECPQCALVSYGNGVLVFTVPGFSTYTVTSNPQEQTTAQTTQGTQTSGGTTSGGGGGASSGGSGYVTYDVNTTYTPYTPYIPTLNYGSQGASSQTVAPTTATASSSATTQAVQPITCPTGTICTPAPVATVASTVFLRNLELGATGSDVQALQKYLNSQGYTVSTAGAGSPGNETQTFGPATKAALARYQASKGLPATGYFGPMTRALLAGSTTIKPTTPIVPIIPAAPIVVTGAKLTRTIYQGSIGEDIRTLQKILNAKGYTVSTTGAGSPGNETTFFGGKTTAAVERLQCATLSICSGSVGTTGYGLVGVRTRGVLNR